MKCYDSMYRIVEARKPQIFVVDNIKKEVNIIDIAIPGDSRVKDKEQKKMEELINAFCIYCFNN